MISNFEEIWDEKSEYIGTDIDDLQIFAGRSLMTRENFIKAAKEVWNAAIEEIAENEKLSKEKVISILTQRRNDAFDNEWHKHEHYELNQAIEIINRLMPPSYFEVDKDSILKLKIK